MNAEPDELERALDTFATELSFARLQTQPSAVAEILTRIEELKRTRATGGMREKLQQLRRQLIEILQTIAKAEDNSSSDNSLAELPSDQQEKIHNRLDAILEFALHPPESAKRSSGGELAWLTRKRV